MSPFTVSTRNITFLLHTSLSEGATKTSAIIFPSLHTNKSTKIILVFCIRTKLLLLLPLGTVSLLHGQQSLVHILQNSLQKTLKQDLLSRTVYRSTSHPRSHCQSSTVASKHEYVVVPQEWHLIFRHINPLKPYSSKCYTLPYTPDLPFLISDIQALWRQTAQMSEIKNGRSGPYGAKHSKCNHMVTLGF